MAKGDDIEERLLAFAASVLDLCEHFPRTFAVSHIGKQLLRSATSAAPNYAEAGGCESRNDFIHKLGIVLKELNESRAWLKILGTRKSALAAASRPLHKECDELCRIIAVSRRTAIPAPSQSGALPPPIYRNPPSHSGGW